MKITILHSLVAFASILLMPLTSLASLKQTGNHTQQYVPGELLVMFKPSASTHTVRAAVQAFEGSINAKLSPNLMHVKLSNQQSVESMLATYQNDPNVEYAQPNYIYHIAAIPNDPNYPQQWPFKNTGQTIAAISPATAVPYTTNNPGTANNDMNLEPAWSHITDCSSVVVAVLDSGVNYNHQDLAANMWNGNAKHGNSFVTTDGVANDPMDLHGHGTHVAGIIGAVGNNLTGSTGVCWKASIMAVRVMDSTGYGTTASIIAGINYAVQNGAKVINASLGGNGAFDQAYSDAITNAQNNDVVVVVAAGNNGSGAANSTTGWDNDAAGQSFYPCNFTQANLICVAALDQNYTLANFSNWGATSVDVGAPGTNFFSAWPGTENTITDALTGVAPGVTWLGSPGFGYGKATPNVAPYTAGAYPSINNPAAANWPTGFAAANTDARLYANFNLTGVSAATLDTFGAAHVVSDGGTGSVAIAYSAVGGDPFAVAKPTYLYGPAATDTTPATVPVFSANPTLSISNCLTAACTIGFQLKTGATTTNLGLSLVGFTINTLTLNNITYKLESGTSMATPAVAGLAAMLRAYNPKYTYADVVASIKNAGRPTASLAGKTTTGKAVDAIRSLSYINAPTGLSATVQ